MEKQTARLENWSMKLIPATPYTPPELAEGCLVGDVYGHPIKEDGQTIVTSKVQEWRMKDNEVETTYTVYEMGIPDPGYVQFCHDNNYPLFPGDLSHED